LPKDVKEDGISFGILPKDVGEDGISFGILPKDVGGERENCYIWKLYLEKVKFN
jgi:hypothetical protein